MADEDNLPGDLDDYPPELRNAAALEPVIAWLRATIEIPSMRRRKLYHWAKSLGLSLDAEYYRRLQT